MRLKLWALVILACMAMPSAAAEAKLESKVLDAALRNVRSYRVDISSLPVSRAYLVRETMKRECGPSILPLPPGAHAQQPPLPDSARCSPQARVITVWKVGSPYENGLPDKAISEDLKLRVKSLGCAIRVEVFPAVGFANRFFAAFERHQEPDVLAVEYLGVIYGVTIRPGGYTRWGGVWRTPAYIGGIASTEAISRALEDVSGSLAGLDEGPSWEFLLRTSRNYNVVRSLALRPPECGVRRVVPSMPGGLLDLIRPVVRGLGGVAPKDHDDVDRLNTVIIDPWPSQVGETKVCGYWGTSRLAFVQTDSTYQAADSLGWVTALLIFRKQQGKWGLLAASIDPITNDGFVKEVPKIVARIRKTSAPSVIPRPADLLAPREEGPAGSRRISTFRWRPSPSGDVVAEVAEFARNGDARLFVKLMSRDHLRAAQISAEKLPVVHGEWRWRVWSISDWGAVAFSAPKSFTY